MVCVLCSMPMVIMCVLVSGEVVGNTVGYAVWLSVTEGEVEEQYIYIYIYIYILQVVLGLPKKASSKTIVYLSRTCHCLVWLVINSLKRC